MRTNVLRFLTILALTVSSAAMSACGASGPAFQPIRQVQAGQGVLYLYRPGQFSGGRATVFVAIGNRMVELENNTYHAEPLPPGQYQVIAAVYGSQSQATVTVEPGGESYLRVAAESSGLTLSAEMQAVSIEEARQDIFDTRLAESRIVQ